MFGLFELLLITGILALFVLLCLLISVFTSHSDIGYRVFSGLGDGVTHRSFSRGGSKLLILAMGFFMLISSFGAGWAAITNTPSLIQEKRTPNEKSAFDRLVELNEEMNKVILELKESQTKDSKQLELLATTILDVNEGIAETEAAIAGLKNNTEKALNVLRSLGVEIKTGTSN